MEHDINKQLIDMAGKKNGLADARSFFLDQAENGYNMLLWKCYLARVANRKEGINKTERIAILGSSNVTPLKDKLKVMFHAHGVDTEFYMGEYNNWYQELLFDERSGLYGLGPSIVVMILSFQDIFQDSYESLLSFSQVKVNRILKRTLGHIIDAVNYFCSKFPESAVYLSVIPPVEDPSSYAYWPGTVHKSRGYFHKFCGTIADYWKENDNIFMLNTGNIIQGYKKEQIADKRYWYLGRIRYTDLFFSELSRELVKVYNMAHSIPKKCLIVDLDGTLWGGIIGEDGRSNIILGQDGLGQAYQDFQREILKLYEKGIILAICSKNNESDVDILLHMDKRMLLKDEHFTSKRINWNDKASNIEEIAKEINIGLDSIVFLDDNPVEREWVRENLPEVTVPEMPEDPSRYAEFLKNSKWFNSYNTTKEDRIRNITYKAVAKSKKLKEKSKNINSFIRDLKQQVIIEDVNTSTISRAVQLSQKTNQFKMNHKRYELSEMKNMIKDKDYKIYTLSLKDCFCDYGIIGLMIMKNDHIDDFILSCRVIGRKIEDVIIDWLKKRLKKEGYSHIYGRYRTSTKNSVCKDVYKENGFISKEEGVLNTGGANTINKYNLKGKVGFSSFKDIIKVKYEGKR